MTQIVRFVDGVSYTEADQSDFNLRMMRPQGVLPESALGTLTPSAIASMNVRVGPGEAHVQGFQYVNDANVDVAIGANSSGSSRIDVVVLRLNRSLNTLLLGVVVGTPGAGAPTLTQVAGGTWEFPITQVTVPNGAVSIVSGNISDQRVMSRWPVAALDTLVALDADVGAEATTRAGADTALGVRVTTLELALKTVAYGFVSAAGALTFGAGVTSAARIGTGVFRITLSAAYTNYVPVCTAQGVASAGVTYTATVNVESTTQFLVRLADPGLGTNVDIPFYFVVSK